eukprot:TRINITY_DN6705_c0_g1_i1.p1 TRINITY_DN6705_c0_g1~~TRINITY_DN6705_c0_g1_i1.p1  ORF type:complete len:497 (-),score=97.24 TRINITY_DN6705_c0_g1_i1:22-1485(-)
MSEPKKVATCKWYQKQKYGRLMGGAFLTSGALLSGLAIYVLSKGGCNIGSKHVDDAYGIPGIAVGLSSVCAGAYFCLKGYYLDPEALKEYHEKFLAVPVRESVQSHGWTRLFLVTHGVDNLREKILSEMEYQSFHYIWTQLHDLQIENLVEYSVIEPETLADYFRNDNDVSDETAVIRIATYGAWLEEHASVTKQEFQAVVVADPRTIEMSFNDLFDAKVEILVNNGHIPLLHVREKFLEVFEYMTFGEMENKYGRWLLDKSIIVCEDVAPRFREEAMDLSFVEFIDRYWDWPVSKYRWEIGFTAEEFDKIRELNEDYDLAKKSYQKLIRTAESRHSRTVSDALEEYGRVERAETKRMNRILAKNPDDKRCVTACNGAKSDAKSIYNRAKSRASSDLEDSKTEALESYNERKRRINKDWRKFLSGEGKLSSLPPIQVVVNNTPPPVTVVNNVAGPTVNVVNSPPQQPIYSPPTPEYHTNPTAPEYYQ